MTDRHPDAAALHAFASAIAPSARAYGRLLARVRAADHARDLDAHQTRTEPEKPR